MTDTKIDIDTVICDLLFLLGPYVIFRFAYFTVVSREPLFQIFLEEQIQIQETPRQHTIVKKILKDSNPDILFLGSSVVAHGIDIQKLFEELKIPKNAIKLIRSGGDSSNVVCNLTRINFCSRVQA